jgi:hypothetical protein
VGLKYVRRELAGEARNPRRLKRPGRDHDLVGLDAVAVELELKRPAVHRE